LLAGRLCGRLRLSLCGAIDQILVLLIFRGVLLLNLPGRVRPLVGAQRRVVRLHLPLQERDVRLTCSTRYGVDFRRR
jgi:hypothetical protein